MFPSGTNQTILITGIDTIRHKNLHQLAGLAKHNCRFVVISADQTGTTRAQTRDLANVKAPEMQSARTGWEFLRLTFQSLFRDRIDLVELYPHTLVSLLLAILVKLFRKPLLLIARGAELQYLTKTMPRLQRLWFRLTYMLADGVLYKEMYFPPLLDTWGIRRRWLLPNAVELPRHIHQPQPSSCRFLFLNSMKTFRHPEVPLKAFLELCEERGLKQDSSIRMTVAGFLGEKADPVVAKKEARLHAMIAGRDVPVEFHSWNNDPNAWLDSTDVFLLPADVVFVNYALLEAMGRAIPAMIQNAPCADFLVTDGEDGFILPLEKDAWKAKMALLMDDFELRARMGEAARRKVAERYSLETYLCKYKRIYEEIIRRRR